MRLEVGQVFIRASAVICHAAHCFGQLDRQAEARQVLDHVLVAARQELRFDEQPAVFDGGRVSLLLLGASGKPDYDPFECLKREIGQYTHENLPMVAVLHPGYVDHYLMTHSSLTLNRAKEAEMLCNPAVREWLDTQGIELITYNDI